MVQLHYLHKIHAHPPRANFVDEILTVFGSATTGLFTQSMTEFCS